MGNISVSRNIHELISSEPICAVGYGVAALFSAKNENNKSLWSFKNYSLTAVRFPEIPPSLPPTVNVLSTIEILFFNLAFFV